MHSRRTFVRGSLAAVASATLLPLVAGASRAHAASGPSLMPSADALTFDMHLHPGAFFYKGAPQYAGDNFVMKTLAEMRAGGMHGGFMSVVSDAPLIQIGANGVTVRGAFEPGEAVREYERQLALLRDLLPKGKARIVTSVTEWERAHADGLVGAWLSCEGSEVLDGDPERIDRVYADGVRSIQVVHYVPNAAGDLQTQPAAHGGLSPLGKAMVKRMNARGMVIDVAHAAFATVKDVVSLTSAPIMLSHSILKIDDARPLNVRAISPEHAKLVAQTGGVIGAWPSATNASFDEFVDNTKRLVDVVGVDHVGLGTDMDANLRPVLATYTQFPDWIKALGTRGFSAAEVEKLAGGNMVRLLRRVTG
jgi:membrane dipeptidase